MVNLSDVFEYRDGDLYWKPISKRGFTKSGKKVGKPNGQGYIEVRTNQLTGSLRTFQVHRLVWELHNGAIPDGMVVDHKNRDVADNLIENLRLATRSENSMNACGKSSSRARLPKNVYIDWQYGGITKYRAQVCICGNTQRIGGFETPHEAMLAAQSLRTKMHGDFACSVNGGGN